MNINGLSQNSKVALEFYIENEQIDVLSLCETNKLEAICFKNFQSYSSYRRKGVSLSVETIKVQQIIELTNDNIDSIFALVERNKAYVVGPAYIPQKTRRH